MKNNYDSIRNSLVNSFEKFKYYNLPTSFPKK